MTSILFQVPMSPISLNHSHKTAFVKGRVLRFKSKETISYENEFNGYLSAYNTLRDGFVECYNPELYSLKIESFFYINHDKYFARPKNKKSNKTISKRSMDLDNIQKICNDLIFKWFGIDDSQITCSVSEKIPTNDAGVMVFRVTLTRFPELFIVPIEALAV